MVVQIDAGTTEDVIDVRAHGRGGQGVVAAVEMISIAALFEGRFSRSFALYGSEMRGAPLSSFASIGPESSITRGKVKQPDHIIVLDQMLPENIDVAKGLKENGTIIYNFSGEIDRAYDILSRPEISMLGIVDATRISLDELGRSIPNTCILGAFARVTDLWGLDTIHETMRQKFDRSVAEKNIASAGRGYEEVEIKCFPGRKV